MLGKAADNHLNALENDDLAMDTALEWLYGRDTLRQERGERSASLDPSALTVPEWINEINRLFPREVIERLELDAFEKYQIDEIVTNLDILEKIEPSETLLKAVLQTKHLMNPEVLNMARKLVAAVVQKLMDKLTKEVKTVFTGTRDRRRISPIKIASNFNFQKTIRHNLHRWDPVRQKLFIEKPIFMSRVKKHTEKWDIIILVDQSGSMVDSVIHAAVMAACLWQLPGMRTRLVAFDTKIIDLTEDVDDPVELLMKVQLGGGTDIGLAVGYAKQKIDIASRTIIVIVSDFFEGASVKELIALVKSCTEAGTKVLGLAALDSNANPQYDRETAKELVKVGAEIGAMTPGELAYWIHEKLQGKS